MTFISFPSAKGEVYPPRSTAYLSKSITTALEGPRPLSEYLTEIPTAHFPAMGLPCSLTCYLYYMAVGQIGDAYRKGKGAKDKYSKF